MSFIVCLSVCRFTEEKYDNWFALKFLLIIFLPKILITRPRGTKIAKNNMPNIKWLLKYPIILTSLLHKAASGSSILGMISDTNKNKTENKPSNGKNKSKTISHIIKDRNSLRLIEKQDNLIRIIYMFPLRLFSYLKKSTHYKFIKNCRL